MANLNKRLELGRELTFTEMDDNFDVTENLSVYLEVGDTYTAGINELVVPNNTTGVANLTLPLSPGDGDFVVVKQPSGSPVTTNAIVIGRNGATIMGIAEDMTLDIDDKIWMFNYKLGATNWIVSQLGDVGDTA